MAKVTRQTVDLSAYPDLVVIYLGMRVQSLRGLKTTISLGAKISAAVEAMPEGLLLHEGLMFSLFPLHVGMRQYWRNFDLLETWARSLPHQGWWQNFLRNPGGTGFWHETYFLRGGIEAVYDGLKSLPGLGQFAPVRAAEGPMFSARLRAGRSEHQA
jgi:hypothetical protein